MLAKVKGLLFASMSQIMKRPFGSEKTLRICKLKVLLKRMLTPAFYSPIHKPIDLQCFQNNGPLAACILRVFLISAN